MTVTVDTNLPLPAGGDPYNLIVDLTNFRSGILDSIADIVAELGLRPETGSNASFGSITCTSTGLFKTRVTVNTADTGSPLLINNSAAAFGFSKGSIKFEYSGGKWVSTSPITIVDGTVNTDAASRGYVLNQVAAVQASLDNLSLTVTALANNTVSRYNGLPDWAPNANFATYSQLADHATGADLADAALNSARVAGRLVQSGVTSPITLAGGAATTITINFSQVFEGAFGGLLPTFIPVVIEDDGEQSINVSIVSLTTTSAVVRLRNVNASTGETFRVSWVVI
jgi:hypothetical protein